MKTETSVLQCAQCDKEFKYESEKRRHELSHVPQFECKVCSKKFSFVSALRRHEKQHKRTASAQCVECGGRFRDESLLKRHVQYAHKGTHKCNKCSAILSSDLALKTHMKIHKPESERKYHCSYEECGKTFNFIHHLKHHELTHTNDKPHICTECGKGFIQLHHFKLHQRVHKPDSWLICAELNCEKEFSNEYALKRHIATHNKKSACTVGALTTLIPDTDIKVSKKSKETKRRKVRASLDCTQYITQEIKELSVSSTLSDIDFKENINIATTNKLKTENSADAINIEVLDRNPMFEAAGVVATGNIDHHKVGSEYEDIEIDDVQLSTSNCTSTLGKCIVTGDTETNESCLCAQMSGEKLDDEFILPTETKVKANVKSIDDLKCLERRLKNVNACETCECASTCGISDRTSDIFDTFETPKLETRNDGVIKIRETFDIDIGNIHSYSNDEETAKEQIDFKTNLMNSCKDILGNCIVSGDGTMGEGCLCAKMSANNQQIIAQEIEEMTPCPKDNWFKQAM